MAVTRKAVYKALMDMYKANSTLTGLLKGGLHLFVAPQEQGMPFANITLQRREPGETLEEQEITMRVSFHIITETSGDNLLDIADAVDAVYDEKTPSITGADADTEMRIVEETGEYRPEHGVFEYIMTYELSYVVT